jgi:hypothetical protein
VVFESHPPKVAEGPRPSSRAATLRPCGIGIPNRSAGGCWESADARAESLTG